MPGLSSLSISISGLHAAQAGLFVTGHNMSNSSTVGYSRQTVIQSEFIQNNVGVNHYGIMQVGLGTDVSAIRQIRDKFLDISYRHESGVGAFYAVKAEVGSEIEAIFGELQSDYRVQSVFQDVWDALNEMVLVEPGREVRDNFISTAVSFITRVTNVYDRLVEYQYNLDKQIRDGVTRVNQLLEKVHSLNGRIEIAEACGDNANDYRDERNLALDELSQYLDIEIKEGHNGVINIMCGGNELLVNGMVNHLGLRYTAPGYSFVEPIFTRSTDILPYDSPPTSYKTLYDLTGPVDSKHANDKGMLKALMVTRGYYPINYSTDPGVAPDPTNSALYPGGQYDSQYRLDYKNWQKEVFNCEYSVIPRIMKQFDILVNKIVTSINNAVAPQNRSAGTGWNPNDPSDTNPPYDHAPQGTDGSTYVEVFSRKNVSRYDGTGAYNGENNGYYSLYTIGNIVVNPELLVDASGANKLCMSLSGDESDSRLPLALQELWNSAFIELGGSGVPLNVQRAYAYIINDIATETKQAYTFMKSQQDLIEQIDNKRSQVSGVAMDEELSNMLVFQHAYNANSRMITTIDSMLDKLINGTGRVGI